MEGERGGFSAVGEADCSHLPVRLCCCFKLKQSNVCLQRVAQVKREKRLEGRRRSVDWQIMETLEKHGDDAPGFLFVSFPTTKECQSEQLSE